MPGKDTLSQNDEPCGYCGGGNDPEVICARCDPNNKIEITEAMVQAAERAFNAKIDDNAANSPGNSTIVANSGLEEIEGYRGGAMRAALEAALHPLHRAGPCLDCGSETCERDCQK